jgi:2-keto-4-pentenoate hydratase
MNYKSPQDLAQALAQAWQQSAPFSAAAWADSLLDGDAAYEVQRLVATKLGWLLPGRPQVWKSGGASRQTLLTHALLAPAGVRHSTAALIDFTDLHLHAPGIEAEIALRIGSEVTPEQAAGLSIEGARDLVDGMAVAIELVSSRWLEAGAAPALLRQADFLSHGALALGDWQPFKPRDWWAQACELRVNDGPVLRGVGGHSLADPAWGLSAWLKHVTRDGCNLPAGSMVTTGAWLSQAGLQPGDRASVGFAGLGSLTVQL